MRYCQASLVHSQQLTLLLSCCNKQRCLIGQLLYHCCARDCAMSFWVRRNEMRVLWSDCQLARQAHMATLSRCLKLSAKHPRVQLVQQ